jgi:hypothetical protein
VTDNTLTSTSDYSQFSVIAPLDDRLPNGGGYAVDGIYNITAAGRAKGAENVQKNGVSYADYKRYWDGFDLTVQARLRNGLTVQGGTSTGRLVEDICDVRAQVPELAAGGLASVTNPYCRQAEPFRTQLKAIATYIVPTIDVNLSATFSSTPGVSLSALQVYTNAQVQNPAFATLGRPLVGAGTVAVNLVEPNTLFGDRIDQLDVRIGKILRFGRTRTNLNLDIVNALNSNDVLGYSPTFSATWPTPTTVLTARLFRVSAQFDF